MTSVRALSTPLHHCYIYIIIEQIILEITENQLFFPPCKYVNLHKLSFSSAWHNTTYIWFLLQTFLSCQLWLPLIGLDVEPPQENTQKYSSISAHCKHIFPLAVLDHVFLKCLLTHCGCTKLDVLDCLTLEDSVREKLCYILFWRWHISSDLVERFGIFWTVIFWFSDKCSVCVSCFLWCYFF